MPQQELDDQIILDPQGGVIDDGTVVRGIDEAATRQTNHILRSLSDLARTLLSAKSQDMQPLVLAALFEHIPAERGFIMLFDEGGRLCPRVIKYRDAADSEGPITVSKTIVDRVVK